MTTRPTIQADKSVGQTLGAAEWNVNALQQARWTQEVIAGTNADKIPGSAMANPSNFPGPVAFGGDTVYSAYISGGFPVLQMATNDFLYYDRTLDTYNFNIATAIKFTIDGTGQLSGPGIYRSSEVTITNTNTGTFAHGFGGGLPSFVHAVYGTVTNNNFNWGMGSVNNINATNITYLNSTGVTIFVKVRAII